MLNIGGNILGNNTEPILQLLLSENPIRILSLYNCNIGNRGARIILIGLLKNNTLKSLNLGIYIIYILIYISLSLYIYLSIYIYIYNIIY